MVSEATEVACGGNDYCCYCSGMISPNEQREKLQILFTALADVLDLVL